MESRSPQQSEVLALLDQYQKGQFELAEHLAKTILQTWPDHTFSWKVLGAVLMQTGRLQDALTANQRAAALSPADPETQSNLGNIQIAVGMLEAAKASYQQAIVIKPDWAEAHYNLGIALQELGRLDDAEASYKNAITIKPGLAEAHFNLGNLLKEGGKLTDAEESYKRAIAIKPDYAEALSNLGSILKVIGRLEDAAASFERAITLKPQLAEAHINLGLTHLENGQPLAALHSAIQSLTIKPSFGAKSLFMEVARKIDVQSWDRSLSQLTIAALLEPWGRPSEVIGLALQLLRADNDAARTLGATGVLAAEFVSAPLLQAMLCSTPIPDAQLEAVLTRARHQLLMDVSGSGLPVLESDGLAALHSALAQQCFINEYVYFETPEEIECARQLRTRLKDALAGGQCIPASWVLTVACYFPLHEIEGAEQLLQQAWPDDVRRVLIQQIQEPLEEWELRRSMPVLTDFDNLVSLAVQNQYEENPYPRWVRVPKDSRKKPLNAYIQGKFPLAPFLRLADDQEIDMLIAGCGTGQHSIGSAQVIQGANILAIDLSKASLAYAKRKTSELGIETIRYAQADILKLASLDQTFDVIESSGVLHHLEDPFEGWQVLLSLLRPNGLMRLGFYSALARRDILRVRELIAGEHIDSSANAIRAYRKRLLGTAGSDFGFSTSSIDFFSTSACRDLLFHAQEHCMNLDLLAAFLEANKLTFLGFEIDPVVIRTYKNRFANDPSAIRLDQWRVFEEENPDTFIGMYQFWIQDTAGSD
jgi:tetratricopeptide (TPR) repeat protein/2-polyprenyl-3-methyl-5-hydroxy-6-metoxy-1,4-benzoquinol methylase